MPDWPPGGGGPWRSPSSWPTWGAKWTARSERFERALDRAEEFCRLFFDKGVPPDSARGLSRYFLHFGVLARRPGA